MWYTQDVVKTVITVTTLITPILLSQILADLWKQAPECEMEKQDTARLFAIMSDEAEEMGMRKAAERILRARYMFL